MPRFFFHMRDEDWLVEDPDGSELPDLGAARAKAAVLARDHLAERLGAGEALDFQWVEIWDDDGRMLETVPFPDPRPRADPTPAAGAEAGGTGDPATGAGRLRPGGPRRGNSPPEHHRAANP